ncbi:hypothetical protein [Phreatobacter sp.]|uniref:hypothetical protein n=1 Tax=Phreatobacter sp. TaxID=1966341 RepID=UPI003F6F271C
MFRSSLLALAAGLALAACQSTAQAPAPAPQPVAAQPNYVTRPDFRLPEGGGCAGDIARFRAVIDNDLATGHVARDVHGRMQADLGGPDTACRAGRAGEALAGLRAVRQRYGYPAG